MRYAWRKASRGIELWTGLSPGCAVVPNDSGRQALERVIWYEFVSENPVPWPVVITFTLVYGSTRERETRRWCTW